MFEDVTYDDDYVYFTLTDGTVITIPRASLLDSDTPPNNEIWYTSSTGNIVTPYATNVFGATIASNTYENGKGIMKFNGNVTEVGYYAFKECKKLTSINIPNSVTSIGEDAFYDCDALKSFLCICVCILSIHTWLRFYESEKLLQFK